MHCIFMMCINRFFSCFLSNAIKHKRCGTVPLFTNLGFNPIFPNTKPDTVELKIGGSGSGIT